MRFAILVFLALVLVALPVFSQQEDFGGGGGTKIETGDQSVDTAGGKITFTCDAGVTCGTWTSTLGESLLIAFGEAGQTGPILQIQNSAGATLDLTHDTIEVSGVSLFLRAGTHGLNVREVAAASTHIEPRIFGTSDFISYFKVRPGPATNNQSIIQTCGSNCTEISVDAGTTPHLRVEATQTTITGELEATDLNTGGNTSVITVCVDVNGKFCECDKCA